MWADLLAKPEHVDVDCLGGCDELVTPCELQQLVPAENAIGIFHEHPKERQLSGGERHADPVHDHGHVLLVKQHLADCETRVLHGCRAAAQAGTTQQRAHPGQELVWRERFGDVVIRGGGETANDLIELAAFGNDDDRDQRIQFSNLLAQANAVVVGLRGFDGHQVNRVGLEDLERDLAVEGGEGGVAVLLEQEGHQLQVEGVALNDQYRRHALLRVAIGGRAGATASCERPAPGEANESQGSATQHDGVPAPSPSFVPTALSRAATNGGSSVSKDMHPERAMSTSTTTRRPRIPQPEATTPRWALYSAPMPAVVNAGLHTSGLEMLVGAKPTSSMIRWVGVNVQAL